MVERHAIGDAAAAIVSGDAKPGKSELLHHRDHVARHRPLRIGRVIGGRGRAAALSVAAQIGAYHGKAARQQRRDAAPHQLGLRETMQQQDRRPRSANAHEDAGFTGLDFGGGEVLHAAPTTRGG
jgi:hypothetical protein